MEGFDRFEPPGLPLLTLGLRPSDGFPIRRKDQARAGVCNLDTIAGGFPYVEEERALYGVFVRARFYVDTDFKEDVSRPQDVFALIGGVGNVVESAVAFAVLFSARQIVRLIVDGKPAAAKATVVEEDLFGDAAA